VGEGTGITVASTTVSTNDSEIVHDNLSGFVANEHIDHSGVTITAGAGLTGGGTIAATRTLAVGAGTGIDVAANSISVDVSDFMTNGSNNRIVTATGADAQNAEETFTYDGDGTLIIDKNVDGIESDPKIAFRKSRGTFDSPAVVQSGDYLGTLEFKGFDGTDYETAASIDFMVDAGGTPAQTATDMPGRIVFKVSPDGSSTDAAAMTIRSTGKVGIGLANPDEELHVYGNIKIENPVADNTQPAHLELYTNDTGTNDGAFIRFTKHVGNQAPADSTNFGEISFNVSAYSAEYERALIFADADGDWVYNAGSFSDTPTRLVFAVYDNALNNQMELNHEGKLTVGGTGANNRLTVRHGGGDADNGIMVYRNDSTTTANDILGGIGFDSGDGNVPSSVLEASAYIAALAAEDHGTGDKGGDLVFGTAPIDQNHDTTSTERMRILSDGNVGIGLTDPSYPLHVNGEIYASAWVGAGTHIYVGQDIIHNGDTNNKISFTTDTQTFTTSGNSALVIDENGHVTKALQPCFAARSSQDPQSFTGTATIKVDFDTEIFDVNADYDVSTQTFTAPVTGKYLFQGVLEFNSLNDSVSYALLTINTSNIDFRFGVVDPQSHATQTDQSFPISVILHLDANDTAHVDVYVNGTGEILNLDGGAQSAGSYWSGYLLG
jgi:hypothetical protein